MTESIYDLIWLTKGIVGILLMLLGIMCCCKYLRKGGQ
jgi:hypothetical protein